MTNNSVNQTQIDALFDSSKIEDIKMGEKTTVVSCTLPSGFVIIESSSCVDPANYNHFVGKDICINRIKNKLWELEGYRLQEQLYDFRNRVYGRNNG